MIILQKLTPDSKKVFSNCTPKSRSFFKKVSFLQLNNTFCVAYNLNRNRVHVIHTSNRVLIDWVVCFLKKRLDSTKVVPVDWTWFSGFQFTSRALKQQNDSRWIKPQAVQMHWQNKNRPLSLQIRPMRQQVIVRFCILNNSGWWSCSVFSNNSNYYYTCETINDLFSSDPTSKVPGNDCSPLDALGFYHDKVIIFNLIRAAVLTKIETKIAL